MSRPRRVCDDDGSILLLTLGCVVIALMLVVVVVDASAVFLARRSLASTTDGASLAAAQSVSSQQVYAHGAGTRLPLDQVQAAVAGYQGDGRGSGLSASVEHEASGDTVTVTGRRSVSLPFASMFGIGPITVTATSRASSVRIAGNP
jgi:uncharacterized membrane protein